MSASVFRPRLAPGRRALIAATALAAGLIAPQVAGVPQAGAQDAPATNVPKPAKKTARHHPAHAHRAHTVAVAAPTAAPVAVPPATTAIATSQSQTGGSESIVVRAQRRLVRERNAPSAVTELGQADISQTGIQGSVATLLRNAPSVYVYQQGIGNNEPVLSIRGVRGLEVAQTLDGVPMQDLQYGGSGSYLSNAISGPFNLDQISGVSILPGVAYPNQNTFGTIGGTVAYSSLRPDDKRSATLSGSVGSFGTWQEAVELQSGKLDNILGGALGTGVDAPSMMVKYSNMQTKGFVDYTPARYNNLYFAFDKPYNQGTSKFQATVIYNTGSGLFTPEPIPEPYTQAYGTYANYSPDEEFMRQNNDYFTLMLNNDSYINDWLSAGVTAFYRYSDTTTQTYANPEIFGPNGEPGSVTVGGASPFNQTIAGFGEQGLYGPGNIFYDPQVYTYDGSTAACPADVTARWAAAGQVSPCGYNAQYTTQHTDTYGIRPRLTITPPRVWGIDNTIQIGSLIAKSTSPAMRTYAGSTPDVGANPANLVSGYDGGTQRTIYQGFAQDRIDFLHNTLHVTPGVTLEGTDSSDLGSKIFDGTPSASLLATDYCQAGNPCLTGAYKAHKWDREWLPFLNVSYDFDKLVPALRGLSVYGSMGQSALFAPVSDFGPSLIGTPPSASIVHMYEGGIKYDTSRVALSLDYFYQHVERDFGYFSYQSGPLAGESFYTNNGQREMKGIEGAVKWQVTPDFQLSGNFSKTLAKYLATSLGYVTVQEDQFGIVQRGTPVTGVPDWIASMSATYAHRNTFLRDDNASIRFTGQYTGRQHTSYDLDGFTNVGALPGVGPFGSYNYYNVTSGATTYDPNGGIAPFMVFLLDANYTMPVKGVGPLHQLGFNLNIYNLFNQHFHQYYYKQVSPSSCGTFSSGPFAGQAISNYGCSPQFADSLPGEPFAVTFTVSAKF